MTKEKRNTPEIPGEKTAAIVMDGHEAALAHRVREEDDSWRHIQEEDVHDFSLADDPMKFPSQCYKNFGEFAFRWFKKDQDRIDEVRNLEPPKRWWIVNASQPPIAGLGKHCDPVHGGIQKLDQLLFFKPRWMFELHQKAKQEINESQDSAGDIKKKAGMSDDTADWVGDRQAEVSGSDMQIGEVQDDDSVSGASGIID